MKVSEMENRAFAMLNSKERKFVIDLSRKENLKVNTTLKRLFRVFIGFLIFSFLLTGICVNEFLSSSRGGFYGFLFAYLFVIFFLLILTPVKIGVKILICRFR